VKTVWVGVGLEGVWGGCRF